MILDCCFSGNLLSIYEIFLTAYSAHKTAPTGEDRGRIVSIFLKMGILEVCQWALVWRLGYDYLLTDRIATAAGVRTAATCRSSTTARAAVPATVAFATVAVIATARVLTVLVALTFTVAIMITIAVVVMVAVMEEGKDQSVTVLTRESGRRGRQSKTEGRCHQQAIQFHEMFHL